MRWQGVANVLRFNWHYYLFAILSASVFFIAARWSGQSLLIIPGLASVGLALVSLVVSYYVYDRSRLFDFEWLDSCKISDGGEVVNLHSGFDESSAGLKKKFPTSRLSVFDFYEPKAHTEVSIQRAQKKRTEKSDAVKISTSKIPATDDSVDAGFVIFSAHEIRDDSERTVFFRELRRILKDSGRIVVAEHPRDIPNLLAYNLGAFHFLTRSTWLATFAGANLRVSNKIKITPFVTAFVLKKDDTAPQRDRDRAATPGPDARHIS